MRRLISMLLIVLICYCAVNLVSITETNNDLATEVTKYEISNESVVTDKLTELNKAKEGKEDKINQLEIIEAWNQEIQNYIQ